MFSRMGREAMVSSDIFKATDECCLGHVTGNVPVPCCPPNPAETIARGSPNSRNANSERNVNPQSNANFERNIIASRTMSYSTTGDVQLTAISNSSSDVTEDFEILRRVFARLRERRALDVSSAENVVSSTSENIVSSAENIVSGVANVSEVEETNMQRRSEEVRSSDASAGSNMGSVGSSECPVVTERNAGNSLVLAGDAPGSSECPVVTERNAENSSGNSLVLAGNASGSSECPVLTERNAENSLGNSLVLSGNTSFQGSNSSAANSTANHMSSNLPNPSSTNATAPRGAGLSGHTNTSRLFGGPGFSGVFNGVFNGIPSSGVGLFNISHATGAGNSANGGRRQHLIRRRPEMSSPSTNPSPVEENGSFSNFNIMLCNIGCF